MPSRLSMYSNTCMTGGSVMRDTDRRNVLGALALGAGGLVASRSLAADGAKDGHAAGRDVAPASDFLPTIPRKSGDPTAFTASLDSAPIKATSGGWAREITARSLLIATDMAGARLFLNPGGSRDIGRPLPDHRGRSGRQGGGGQLCRRRSLVFPEGARACDPVPWLQELPCGPRLQ